MAVKKINSLNEHQNLSTNENPFNIEDYMNANWDKIKDVVNNNADELTIAQGKLEELQNYDVTEIKKDIEEIKTEQTEQNEEIDLIANMIPTLETEEAEELNVKSSRYYGKLDLKGNTSQEVRSGKNLLNVPSNLVISVYKEIQINLKANNTYTLKFENAIAGADNNQSLITFRNTIDIVSRIIDTTTTKKITVQPEQDVTNIRIYASTDYAQSAGKTKTFEKLMVYEGTDEEEYEEYGVSPSTKYPSKIHNVEGNVEINICNKNVANLDIKEYQHHVTTEKVATNIFKVTRTEDTSSSYGQVSMNLKTNKTYTIYVKISGTNTAGAFVGVWKGYNASGVYKSNVTNYATIQTTQELLVLGLYPNQTENLAGLETTFEIMIVEGNRINESFIAHEGQEITFPLEEGQKLYKGSYLGEEKIHHVRKQVEFDGTEDWMLEEGENYFDYVYSVNFPDCKIGWQKSICTHFKNVNGSYAVNIGKVGYYSDYTNTRKYFCTDKATLQKWKEWLAEQKQAGTPVTIEYALAEEETEEMTEQQKEVRKQLQKIMTYYPETNVTNNQKALMKLTYKMNLNDAIVALQKLSIV